MAEIKTKDAAQPDLGLKLAEQEEWFDLLPVEKKLIGWSLSIGIVMLFILVFVSHAIER